MKLQPFKELIKMSTEKIDEALAPIRAKCMEAKANLKKAQIEESIITLEREVNEMCMDKDLDLDQLLSKLDKVELLERKRNQYTEVISQLFPDLSSK